MVRRASIVREPGGRFDGPALRRIERGLAYAALPPSTGLFQVRLAVGDGERLAGVALRRDAADRIAAGMPSAPALPRVELEHLAAQVHAFAAHTRPVRRGPDPRVAVLAAGGLDDVVPRGRRRLGQVLDGRLPRDDGGQRGAQGQNNHLTARGGGGGHPHSLT